MSNNTNGTEHSFLQEPFGVRVFRLGLFTLVFMVALIGNIFVLLIIYKTPALRTVAGYMIGNLAIADLAVTILCAPITVVYFEQKRWIFGDAMCKIMNTVQLLSVMASVGTLTFISIDRYRCITRTFSSRLSMRVFTYIIILVWLISFMVAIPLGVLSKEYYHQGVPYCIEHWPDSKYKTVYDAIFFSLSYALPLLIMFCLYIGIAKALKKAVIEGGNREGFTDEKKKDKLLRLLLALVISYALCYLVYWSLFFWVFYGDGETNRGRELALAYAVLPLYINSAMNPIMYAFMGSKFKKGFKNLIRCKSGSQLQSGRTIISNNVYTIQTEASL